MVDGPVSQREMGELVATVKAMFDRLTTLEGATRDGFKATQDRIERVQEKFENVEERLAERLTRLERFRYYVAGGIALLGFLLAYGLIRGFPVR